MSYGNDVYLSDSLLKKRKPFFVQELDVTIMTKRERQTQQTEIKGVPKPGSSLQHMKGQPKSTSDRLTREMKCFKKSTI